MTVSDIEPADIAAVQTAAVAPTSREGVDPRPGRARAFLRALLVVSDILAVNLAFYVAWYLRYELMVGGDVETFDLVPYDVYLPLGLVLSGLVVVIFFFGQLYRGQQPAFWFNDLFAIFGRCGFAVMTLFAAVTMIRYPASSRLTFVLGWALSTAFTAVARMVLQGASGLLHRRGIGTERVLVVGDNSLGRMVMQSIAAQPHLGLQVVGFLDQRGQGDFGRFRHLGSVEDIEQVACRQLVDQVIIALPSDSHDQLLRIVEHCRTAGVRFKIVPDLFEMSLSQVDLDTVSGVPLIDLREVSIEGWNLFLKRTLDVLLTLLALIPGGILMLVIALLVKLDSPGPVIYRQARVGKGGRLFTCYKFRSMVRDADREREELESLNRKRVIFKLRRDPRLTRVGAVLRRASLDELPQLFNVLRGDMSLVGPRPPVPREVEQYSEWERKRLQVAPGLTGLWQVSGRSDLEFDEMVMMDLTYIQNWSLSLDLSILLRTVPAVLFARGAY